MKKEQITYDEFRSEIVNDFKLACLSREASLLGRKEVLTGKAKFGIFGDGKEIAQIAMAKAFKKGDFRSGYYRDQTFMMAIGELSLEAFFFQLYSETNINKEPASGGRQMNNHFATRSLDENGDWKDLTNQYNSSSDISPTGSQMPRLLGLAHASKTYRNIPKIDADKFSCNGNEISFGTIGNASTSEGIFFETVNAAGVLQVPVLISIWDDRWGISVPSKYQTTKEDISQLLKGFQKTKKIDGIEIFTVNGWNYKELCETYLKAEEICRNHHTPVIIHVKEMTQPQGHSTSGSHERYKSKKELEWEKEYDCIKKMKEWIVNEKISSQKQLEEIEKNAKELVKTAQRKTWNNYLTSLTKEKDELLNIINSNEQVKVTYSSMISNIIDESCPTKRQLITLSKKILRDLKFKKSKFDELENWLKSKLEIFQKTFSSHLYSESKKSIKYQKHTEITNVDYPNEFELVDGRVILRDNFECLLKKNPKLMIFGEDSGKIGDVNQGLEGLQQKFGEERIFDTGIREATIIGQGIGLAMRGLKPIAEIQYLDYLLYAIQILSDDLATLQYRTVGGQKAPLIIRTRGHRLEGIWHSGSPIGGIINLLKGINILVPRNMMKAAGFYNNLINKDEPALVIECLNGYRLKEKMPSNLGEFETPIGKIEIIRSGVDITLVTYGSCCRIAMDAAEELMKFNISLEIIDVQSLIPFDTDNDILKSIEKTNRVVFMDEDVPGGATAYMMQKVLEGQNAYNHLDSMPHTITSMDHRPAYGDDGDYFSKSNIDNVIDKCYNIMNETNPEKFPKFY
ncbi:MAG: thiamine pyrophosphate-dependent enzyme [Bacteroidota bacterium]|nr:thiamine pyrophosphate-dependent enzyme [Bacteroidota bacterium]